MEMSIVLQVALFLASLSIVACVACLVPLAFRTRQQVEQIVHHLDELKVKATMLADESQELAENLNTLCRRANEQMDDISEVVHTVRHWSERADRIVEEVGSALEPPVFSLARNMNLLRTGVSTFIQHFMNHRSAETTNQEESHV